MQLLGFDRLELSVLKSTFRQESRRGRLSKSDFESVLARLTGSTYSSESRAVADALFGAMDTDGNGTLDWNEFYCGMAMLCRGSVEERLEVAFGMFDADGNGSIEERELRRLLLRLAGPGNRGRVDVLVSQIMRDADLTRDRRLSFAEFRRSTMASGVLQWMEETKRELESRLERAVGGVGGGLGLDKAGYGGSYDDPYRQDTLDKAGYGNAYGIPWRQDQGRNNDSLLGFGRF